MWKSRVERRAAAEVTTLQARTAAQIQIDDAAAKRQAVQAESQAVAAAAAVRQQEAEHAAKLRRDELNRQAKQDRWAARAAERDERRARRAAAIARLRERAGHSIAGMASAVVYVVAMIVAAIGQMLTARDRHLPMPVLSGIGLTLVLEGAAIASAMTYHAARLNGERAPIARAFTWLATIAASAVQVFGHHDRSLGILMAIATVTAVVVLHMRMAAAVRKADADNGVRAAAQFGARRWLVAPGETVRAWRADVLSRTSDTAAAALTVAAERKHNRKRQAAAERAARAYNKAVLKALRKGNPLPVIVNADTTTDTPDADTADTMPIAPVTDTGPAWLTLDADADTLMQWVSAGHPDIVDTGRGQVLETVSATADTRTDTVQADTPAPEADNPDADSHADTDTGDADTRTDTVQADTTPDADSGADAAEAGKPKPKKRRTRVFAKKADTTNADKPNTKKVDSAVMEAAVAKLRADGTAVTARALEAVTPYGHTACGNWLRKNN